MFQNDPGEQKCFMENAVFILYYGQINDIITLKPIMEAFGTAWQTWNHPHNVVLVTTGFSDHVLGLLAQNIATSTSFVVLPLVVPKSPMPQGQHDLLLDLAAVTGAKVLDPVK